MPVNKETKEINNECKVNFLQKSLLRLPHTYSSEVSLGQSNFEIILLIWYEAGIKCLLYSQILPLRWMFNFKNIGIDSFRQNLNI